ncbi:hypothetical protein OIU84_006224 [Salix udensis]|uniref:RING-type domain-containing protein n=1 Tax=Salix udensis TaxID=889485 RepID=A0AAD6P258_9ROSI|nr:hypothetical protein OIU84_006224 [Salix udensis]
MPRFTRTLSTQAAEPPEAVNLESDLVVILASLLCALICVVGLVAAARCACLRRVTGGASNGPHPQGKANKGVKKKNLQLLPRFTYSAGGGGATTNFGSTECAICLGDFVEGDEVRVLPHCGHGFHVVCIDKWLGSHSSCPSCRQILVVPRCQKCGHFPASTSSAPCGGGKATEVELSTIEDGNASNGNINRAHDAGAFLP